MSQYAIVDVDDDTAGDISGQGLEFKTFLSTDPAPDRSGSAHAPRDSPNVPFSPFDIAYYQCYFQVDTNTILKRCGMAMIPREGFTTDVCEGQMDLYGPFWTLTTLILLLYTTSTLTSSLTTYLSSPPNPTSSTAGNVPLLSTATTLIYLYGLLLPTLLWITTRYLKLGGADPESGNPGWSVVEALGIYGYAMTVFVPVALGCLIPVAILRWVLVGAAAASSGLFLVRNIYPVLSTADNKMARLLIILVVVLHLAMALSLKILFFSYSVGGVNVDPIEDPVGF